MFGINKSLTKKISFSKESKKKASKKETKSKAIVPDLICKSYIEGCLILGCIHDVSNSELIVSLPGIGNFGFVKLNNISKSYTDLLKNELKEQLSTLPNMYSKGNLLRCKVLNYANKKLNLTIEPHEVNSSMTPQNLNEEMIISGAIKTKEDHGYTVELGIDELTGFFRTNEFNLSIGQCCLFKIMSKKSERTISLKLFDDNQEESFFYEIKTRSKFDTYLPGAQLTCTVEKSGKNGIQASVSNQINAYVHSNHIPVSKRVNFVKKTQDNKNNNTSYSNGDKITGTIIFLNPYSKVIYLSLLPHLLDSTKIAKVASLFLDDEENLKIGQIIEDAQVTTHTYKGIYVKFKGENSKLVSGFIPKRHLFDANGQNDEVEEEENDETNKSDSSNLKKAKNDPKNMNKEELEHLFPINTNIKARIYDFSLIEDIILLSVRPSVLEAPYMTYNELNVGQIVKCTVRSINPINGGVNVKLSEFVSGFIPKIHTSDVPLSDALLPRKMKSGTELKCKILQLDSDGKRCVLTAKKSLIKSKLETIELFSDLKLGLETYGVVVSIQKYGLLLSFFNDLKGLIPRNQLSTSSEVLSLDKDLKEIYYVGQVIKCKVFEFNREKQLLKLSLIMPDDLKSNLIKTKNSEKTLKLEEPEYEIGDLIESATILQVNEENYYFRVKLTRGKVNGIIYKNHLSDFDCLNDILFECYKRTMKINNLMITRYSSDVTKNQIENNKVCHYLTLKTSLIDEYTKESKNEIAKTFTDLKVNDLHHGWIRKILNNGILVEMPFNLIGFSSNQDISYINEFKSTLNSLSIGQSVLIKIAKLYEDKKQFITSIRTRHNLLQKNSNENNFMIELFRSFLVNTKNIFDLLANNKPTESNSLIHPNSVANKQVWENAASKLQIGSIVKVAVKSFNKITKQIECLFLNDLNEIHASNLVGIAFASSNENLEQGAKLDALILAFDPLAKVFCLSIDNKQIKIYKKNFDPKFRSQLFCKQDQAIKSEIIYISEWFCILGLKAHALGRLAFMPLFKNDFTQLNTFSAEPLIKSNSSIETKIKRQQLLQVSSASFSALLKSENNTEPLSLSNENIKFSKEDKNFSYYCIGQTGKVLVKLNGLNEVESLDYLIAVYDSTEIKKNKKLLLRQLAILNEKHQTVESGDSNKKLNENNDPIIIRKKLVLENNKRKLSNISNQEENKDFIEIVADIKSKKPKLEISETNNNDSFPWDVTSFDIFNKVLINLNDGNVNEQKNASGKTEKPKKVKNFIDDQKLHEIEENAFDPNRKPESIDDYERLVISSPNSSYLWIKYMAFFLQMGESEKARNIANKALAAINYREEGERLNVWIALLNLENLHGSQASIDDTFNKATQNCDSFKVHCHMAEIYANASKLQEAEDIYIRMTRKFNTLLDTWTRYAIYHYKNSNCEAARKILMRSLNSLDKRDHVEIVNKFAQLEFKYGDVERAKTMYDSLLFTYPNRTDIWSVYIDLLIKNNRDEDARHIFNRIVQIGLTAKRMKFIFKKFMDFEKTHGNEEEYNKVKEMAIKYVETNKTNNDDEKKDFNSSIESNLKRKLFIQNE